MINFLFWVIIILFVLDGLATILKIGKFREPFTKEYAVVNVIMTGCIIWVLVLVKFHV